MAAASAGGEPISESHSLVSYDSFVPGSICIKLGFEQHYGECWNDAMSMIFLFADGYKEKTQPLLIDTLSHSALIDSFMKKITPPLSEEADTKLRDMLGEYLQFLSYRFQYHIKHIQESGNVVPKRNRSLRRLSLRCSLKTATGLLEILKFLKEYDRFDFLGINAMSSYIIKSIPFKTGMERNWIGYNAVGTYHHISIGAFQLLHSIFGFTNKKHTKIVSAAGIAYLISIRMIGIGEGDVSHTISIFKCNDKWYLYDDNMVILNEFTPDVRGEKELITQLAAFYEEKGIPIEVESINIIENIETSMLGGKRRRTRRRCKTRRYRAAKVAISY